MSSHSNFLRLWSFNYRKITRANVGFEFLNPSKTSSLPCSSVTSQIEIEMESADVFGTLNTPLEQTGKMNSSRNAKNAKLVKVRRFENRKHHKESNVFGNLSNKDPMWYPDIKEAFRVDNDLSDDSVIVRNISKKYRDPKLYLERMKDLVHEKKLKEALELFVDMRRNFVTLLPPHFTFMIGACGRAGYTDMAFQLFRQMTDRGIRITPATLTGLFNSCAESPFPEYGLKKAKYLQKKVADRNWEMTQPTYHAMIKAFGKCGDIQSAFKVVDQMKQDDIAIDGQTYAFLLTSCISDKEAGFTHAVEVFRKMKARKCLPSIFTFNLLLRAARDCKAGPEEISSLLLQHWTSYLKRPYGLKMIKATPEQPILKLPADKSYLESAQEIPMSNERTSGSQSLEGDIKVDTGTEVQVVNLERAVACLDGVPVSVLGKRPEGGSQIMELGNLDAASDRLALMGGAGGILAQMVKEKVTPTIKTFTLLLECLPNNSYSEEELLGLLETYKVKPDMGFFNILIKRRSFRYDYAAAQDVLILANKWSLSPDIITFGVLALGCTTIERTSEFLCDMKKLGFFPNINIIGSLLANACKTTNFEFLETVLTFMEEEDIQPNEKMLKKIEETLVRVRKNVIDMEHGNEVPEVYKIRDVSKQFKHFCNFYENWLKNIKFEQEHHVWAQYKTDIYDKAKVKLE